MKQLAHPPVAMHFVVAIPRALYNGLRTAKAQRLPPIFSGVLLTIGSL